MQEKLKTHNNLKAFYQLGFIYRGETSNQVFGYSIFSGKNKFYINPETKKWDCKNTGLSGGYQSFIQEVFKLSQKNITTTLLNRLKKNRGLLRLTLKHHQIGYSKDIEKYIIPLFDANHDKLLSIKLYDLKSNRLTNIAGSVLGLYGWEDINSVNTIWLCEGEWDKMAMWEILYKNNLLKSQISVAVPGANTFKLEWASLFKDKNVIVVYDNDYITKKNELGAGTQGAIKVFKILKNITESLKFVKWPEKLKDGYDIRDLLIEKQTYKKALHKLKTFVRINLPIPEDYSDKVELLEEKSNKNLYTGSFIPAKEVYNVYRKWLYLPDKRIIDVIFGSIIANRLPGDPLWIFIVAPSGGAKSEILMSISEAPQIFSTTVLTPHALISGANFAGGSDPSYIPQFNNKTVIIKDFTTILDMNEGYRQEIFSILRDAYDGKVEKIFGNGIHRSYKSNFGIIAGTTGVIDLYTNDQVALGERFLKYRWEISENFSERKKYIKRALDNTNKSKEMREELIKTGTEVLSYNYEKIPKIPTDIEDKLVMLAQITATLRASVIRDKFSKEILSTPIAELGTRLVKQYTKFLCGVCMFKGKDKITFSEYKLIKILVQGSFSQDLNNIVRFLYLKNRSISSKEIIDTLKLPQENARRQLENLIMKKVLTKRKADSGMLFEYKIEQSLFELLKLVELYD